MMIDERQSEPGVNTSCRFLFLGRGGGEGPGCGRGHALFV